jgi:hypothetical protein
MPHMHGRPMGSIWMASALQSSVAVASRTKCGVAFIK